MMYKVMQEDWRRPDLGKCSWTFGRMDTMLKTTQMIWK